MPGAPPLPPELRSRPPGEDITLEGRALRCFDLAQYKELGHIWIDYVSLYKYSIYMNGIRDSLELELGLTRQRVELWKQQAAREKERGDLLRVMYDQEHGRLVAWEKQSKAMAWVPWAIVVVESLVIGAVGIWAATEGYKEN